MKYANICQCSCSLSDCFGSLESTFCKAQFTHPRKSCDLPMHTEFVDPLKHLNVSKQIMSHALLYFAMKSLRSMAPSYENGELTKMESNGSHGSQKCPMTLQESKWHCQVLHASAIMANIKAKPTSDSAASAAWNEDCWRSNTSCGLDGSSTCTAYTVQYMLDHVRTVRNGGAFSKSCTPFWILANILRQPASLQEWARVLQPNPGLMAFFMSNHDISGLSPWPQFPFCGKCKHNSKASAPATLGMTPGVTVRKGQKERSRWGQNPVARLRQSGETSNVFKVTSSGYDCHATLTQLAYKLARVFEASVVWIWTKHD